MKNHKIHPTPAAAPPSADADRAAFLAEFGTLPRHHQDQLLAVALRGAALLLARTLAAQSAQEGTAHDQI